MPDTTLPAIPGSPTGTKNQVTISNGEGAAVKRSSEHKAVVAQKPHREQVNKSQEYIPEEILAALKKPEPLSKDIIRSRPLGGRAENAWFHGDVAKKYQHLIDHPPCSCGIGPRDISFLYDSVKNEERVLPTPHIEDKGLARKEALDKQAAAKRKARDGELPDTLIPREFHLVQSKAALGLEYNKERFSVKTKDHEEHLTKFPSLKPVSRKEIMELRNVMDKMLSAVGVEDSSPSPGTNLPANKATATATPGGAPTQMHSLLSLVKQEQDIYNVIFHEIIRQTTVECKERGEILAALRQRYANLLDKVPRQVRSMHAEVMAQRALDRRLTEELLKFKTAINSLTGELTDVREQEQKIAEQSRKAKEELKNSLVDSEKNASLLTEYHDLYELQRQRLEHQISVLSEEKEIWSTACYTMAVKITENNRLNTAKRLHMAEKTWAKLSSHYALFLADRDCELMSNLQSHVDKWRGIISEMNYNIATGDKASKITLMGLKDEINERCQTYQKTLLPSLAWDEESVLSEGSNSNLENKVVQPSAEAISRFHQDLKKWQEMVLNEVDKYSGDTLMQYQEQYALMKKEIELWNEIGQRVFARHVQEDGSRFPEHEKMITVNETIDKLMKQFNTLILGENGSAKFLIQLNNEIDQWEIKMHSLVNGAQSLSESDWLKFLGAVRVWPSTLETIISYIGKTRSFDQIGKPFKELTLEEALKAVQVWLASATNGIDNETQKIIEKVSSVHKSLIHWMVQVLLRLAPDRPDNIGDSYNASFSTMEQIEEQEVKLERSLLRFSEYLISCCGSAVMDPERGPTVDTDAEYRDLKKISKESTEWVNTAKVILQELKGDVIVSIGDVHATDRQDTLASTLSAPDSATQETSKRTGSHRVVQLELKWLQVGKMARKKSFHNWVSSTNADVEAAEDKTETVDGEGAETVNAENAPGDKVSQQQVAEPKAALQAICTDKNVRQFDLEEQRQQDVEVSTEILQEKADVGSQEDPKKAYESIAFVEQLQAQIIDTEKRAQSLEQRALDAEQKLQEALEQLREANTNLQNVQRDADREKEKAEEEAEAEQTKKEDAEIAAQRARNAAASRGANRPAPASNQGSNPSSRKTSVSSQQGQSGSQQQRATGSAKRGQGQASSSAKSPAGHKTSVGKK